MKSRPRKQTSGFDSKISFVFKHNTVMVKIQIGMIHQYTPSFLCKPTHKSIMLYSLTLYVVSIIMSIYNKRRINNLRLSMEDTLEKLNLTRGVYKVINYGKAYLLA